MSLTELKVEILGVYGINVSLQMVMCSLQQEGYTMKIVMNSNRPG